MVLHWSIFTLSTQLILCASIYSSKFKSNQSITFKHQVDQLKVII